MQDMEDIALLRQYALTNSEEAFSQLVERHLNLVYSAAVRQVGNPSQAEDITQAVFAILARKAGSLGCGVILPGWLYQTTRLTAANSMRTEIRRARREQEAYMQSLVNESEPEVWTQIAPLLESAMGDLNQKERDAIVLRFFQGKSMQEVGRAFGGSENAAKKRVQRALEKLRNFFAKRKVVLTTAIIAGAVSAHSVQAAPGGLAATVTAVAAKGAAASGSTLTLIKGALKIMAWTKLKTSLVVGAAILFAAGTTTFTVKKISHYRENSVWRHLSRIDSRQLEAAPTMVSIRPSKFLNPMMRGTVWSGGKVMGFASSVTALLSEAYDISEYRIVNAAELPTGKYDFIVSLPNHQTEALQAEVKKKLGLVAKREMRETEVLLLKVARQNAPGLAPAAVPSKSRGSGARSAAGQFTCNNQPISSLTSFLQNHLRTPVIDKTDLSGRYDIDLQWSEPGGYQNPNPEALKQAVLDKLGLELTPDTQSIEMLVVEKVK